MTFLFCAAGQRPGTANHPGKAQQAALQLLAPRRMRAAFSGQHTAKITVILTQRRRNVKPCPPAARPLLSAPKPLCRHDCKRLFYHFLSRKTLSCSPAFLRTGSLFVTSICKAVFVRHIRTSIRQFCQETSHLICAFF